MERSFPSLSICYRILYITVYHYYIITVQTNLYSRARSYFTTALGNNNDDIKQKSPINVNCGYVGKIDRKQFHLSGQRRLPLNRLFIIISIVIIFDCAGGSFFSRKVHSLHYLHVASAAR